MFRLLPTNTQIPGNSCNRSGSVDVACACCVKLQTVCCRHRAEGVCQEKEGTVFVWHEGSAWQRQKQRMKWTTKKYTCTHRYIIWNVFSTGTCWHLAIRPPKNYDFGKKVWSKVSLKVFVGLKKLWSYWLTQCQRSQGYKCKIVSRSHRKIIPIVLLFCQGILHWSVDFEYSLSNILIFEWIRGKVRSNIE